ncbi:MAG TPA: FprA family A-type flavoprotein, partial [Bacteroidales bacterium]
MGPSVLKITKDVSWIGILDKEIVTFDIVMETKYGTTYNSYFINAEKKTIVETAKEKFSAEYLEKVKAVVNPAEIEYIVLNHTEPDHSGSLKHLLEIAPQATVVGSGQALNYLSEMVGKPFKSLKVKDGDVLDLGNKKLRVIGAPNLHWPDSIYTWLEEDKILFTCDSFGAHFCHDAMFDDQVGNYDEAFKYYFDVILKPFSKFMLKAIEKIRPLPIEIICNGHGPILRSTWKEKIDRSEKYAKEYLEKQGSEQKNILIAYVSAYGYTKIMAENIAKGIRENSNYEVDVTDIENILLGDLDEKLTKANAIIVGSPTINQNTLLPVYKLFALINPIRDRGKLAAAFGSYGWSGEAVGLIENHLKNLKLKIFCQGLASKFYPHN